MGSPRCRLGVVLSALLLVSCGDCVRAAEEASSAEPAKPVAVVEPRDEQARKRKERARAERAVRALVERWVQAQNTGDFAAYRALYAQTMLGIKRADTRVSRFERDGWLADRARMFRRPMKVDVSDLELVVLGRNVVASFTQRWRSRSYADVGAKRVVWVREGGQWRIGREEMLESRLQRAAVDDVRFPVERFAFAQTLSNDVTFLILDDSPGGALAGGPPRLIDDDDPLAAEADALPDLPVASRALVGREVRVFAINGGRCRATIEAITVLSVVNADGAQWLFGDRLAAEIPAREIAEAVMRIGGPMLAARLDQPCRGALWGQLADSPEPRVLRDLSQQPQSVAVLDAALAASEREPIHARHQQAWRQLWQREGGPPPSPVWSDEHLQRHAWGGEQVELVSVSAYRGGCAALFRDALLVTYRNARGALRRRFESESALGVWMVFDLDLDGHFELLLHDDDVGLYLVSGPHLPGVVESYNRPALGCRC